MKRIIKSIFLVLTLVFASFTLTACMVQKGESAYDIAVKNGFKGSEKEWLESLTGKDGKDGESMHIMDIYEETKKHKELYELCQTNGKPAVIVDKLLEYHQEKAIKVYQCNKKQAYEILKVAGMKYSDSNFYKILTNHNAGHLFEGDLKPKKI
jgi:hypothetical protein